MNVTIFNFKQNLIYVTVDRFSSAHPLIITASVLNDFQLIIYFIINCNRNYSSATVATVSAAAETTTTTTAVINKIEHFN